MKARQIVRVAGVAAVAWVGIVVAGLVHGASGPAPDPDQLLIRLTLGPLALLAAGNALAWLAARMERRAEARKRLRPEPPDLILTRVDQAHRA
jgi:hypothetical protein